MTTVDDDPTRPLLDEENELDGVENEEKLDKTGFWCLLVQHASKCATFFMMTCNNFNWK